MYLRDNFDKNLAHYVKRVERELDMSDPMPGVTVEDQINCFNRQFITEMLDFITVRVLQNEEAPAYMVSDGLPTSRRGRAHHSMPANSILDTWRANPGRGVAAREDCAGDHGVAAPLAGSRPTNPFYGAGDNHMMTGIMFCDQSNLGMQNHINQYENTLYKCALNDNCETHYAAPFGVSTPWTDARLLSRRTFRSNESGVENAVPNYEARLYRRNFERDIGEGLRNAEKGCMVLGHDMTSLNRRLEHKKHVRALFNDPGANFHSVNTAPLYSNMNLPDELRYC